MKKLENRLDRAETIQAPLAEWLKYIRALEVKIKRMGFKRVPGVATDPVATFICEDEQIKLRAEYDIETKTGILEREITGSYDRTLKASSDLSMFRQAYWLHRS